MKKYLTKEQSDILINLGLPPVQHCIETWNEGKIERLVRYTIGDLLELLPNQTGQYYEPLLKVIKDGNQEELIDTLFDCIVTLKRQGVI